MGFTLSEKILGRASGKTVGAGEFVIADIDLAMAHDGTGPLAISRFRELGGKKVWDANKIIFVFDHVAPSAHEGSSKVQKEMREFAREQGVRLYDVGAGVCHQLLPELGHVKPGMLIVGADSHTCTYGALGAFSTGLGSTEMAAVFKLGKLWFKVPETLNFIVEGELPRFVTAKDVILRIIGKVGADGATYKAVRFTGSTVKRMSVEGRMTLCNMAVEMGAKTGYVEPDDETLSYLKARNVELTNPVRDDSDANYEEERSFEVEDLEPQVACPHQVDNVKPISEVEGVRIDQVFIGSCTNGRFEDLKAAADLLKGRKIHEDVRVIVIPASREVYLKALVNGLIEVFLRSGCVVCNPGCGPCLGAHQGIPAPGEVCISTSNRNFIGRMGCSEANIYLASPYTAAASAIKGMIADPVKLEA